MARWKLVTAHYLFLSNDPAEWEYKEINRSTGRPQVKKFSVPRLVDPTDPSCWTEKFGPDDGMVVVTNAPGGNPRDLVFVGDPTPDMVPMDEEATAISKTFEDKWKHPIESLDRSYGDKLVQNFQAEIDKIRVEQPSAKVEGMTELLTAMTAMMKQNQELITSLTSSPS